MSGDQLGTIGIDGQYEADPMEGRDFVFQLAKNAQGQWRISNLPPELSKGLLLTRSDVVRGFRTLNLYFFTPDGKALVPNGIFLPLVDRQALATQLVRALLGGPTEWLAPAVRTFFPAGTRLRGDRVDITDGIATVDLTSPARQGSPEGMSAQLSWTLRQLPEIRQLRVQVDGETLEPSGAGANQSSQDYQAVNLDAQNGSAPQIAHLRGPGNHLSYLSDGRATPQGLTGDDRLYQPAVSLDRSEVAGLDAKRQVLYAGVLGGSHELQEQLRVRRSGAHFTTPTWDREGTLWVVESTKSASWLWVRPRGRKPQLAARWDLSANAVHAFRVARDGVRAAALVEEANGHSQILLGRIVRGASGTYTAEAFLPISSELVDATALAWSNSGQLAVLGRTVGATQVTPYLVPVGGGAIQPVGSGTLGEPTSIAAAPNSPVLIGATLKGKSLVCSQDDPRSRYREWLCNVSGADPAYPG